MVDHMVDLDVLAKGGKVRNLSGKERGVEARAHLKLDELDALPGVVSVVVPDYLDAISPSFFQGLFSQSITMHGKDGFLKKYKFDASESLRHWIDIGIRNATSSRAPLI